MPQSVFDAWTELQKQSGPPPAATEGASVFDRWNELQQHGIPKPPAAKTLADAMRELGERPSKLLPVVGSAVEAVDTYKLWAAARAAEHGTATDEQRKLLLRFAEDAARPKDVGYMVGSILTELPAFVGEMALGGMAFEKLAARGIMGKAMRESVEAAAAKGALGAVVAATEGGLLRKGAVALTRAGVQAAAMPQRVVATSYRRAMPDIALTQQEGERMAVVFAGTSREFLQALPEGLLDTYIETLSEASGGLLERLPPLSWIQSLQGAVAKRWLSKRIAAGMAPDKALDELLTKIGRYGQWNGVLAEMGEERVGDVMRAGVGLQEWKDVMPDAQQLASEFIAFSVPGAGAAALRARGKVPAGEKPTQQPTGTAQPASKPQPAGTSARADLDPEQFKEWAKFEPKARKAAGREGVKSGQQEGVWEASSEAEQWAAQAGRRFGAHVYFFDVGGPSQIEGYTAKAGRTIFLDRNLPDEQKKRWVAVHELTHHLEGVSPKVWKQVLDAVQQIAPDQLKAASERYASRRRAATGKRPAASIAQSEGLGELAQEHAPFVKFLLDNPAALEQTIRVAPTFGERLLDALASILNKIPGVSVKDSAYRRLAALRAKVADANQAGDPRLQFEIARVITEGLVQIEARPVEWEGAPVPDSFEFVKNGKVMRARVLTRETPERKHRIKRITITPVRGGKAELPDVPTRDFGTPEEARQFVYEQLAALHGWETRAAGQPRLLAPPAPERPQKAPSDRQKGPSKGTSEPKPPEPQPEQDVSSIFEQELEAAFAGPETTEKGKPPETKPEPAAAPAPSGGKGRIVPRRRPDGSVEYVAEPIEEKPKPETKPLQREKGLAASLSSVILGAVGPRGGGPAMWDLKQLSRARDVIDRSDETWREWGFVRTDGEIDRDGIEKVLDEAIEMATVRLGRLLVANYTRRGESTETIYAALQDLYLKQPKLSIRTAGSKGRQAYSTPIPLAYLASRLAVVHSADSVLEPTAGNGALLIEAALGEQNVIANELDPERLEFLRDLFGTQATQGNALDEPPPWGTRKVDVVIMNPPFGRVADPSDPNRVARFDVPGGWSTSSIDHVIALRGLSAMRDSGRAVLIVAGQQDMRRTTSRGERETLYRHRSAIAFWQAIYAEYGVVDHFTVEGNLYARQGAAWPVDVVVIRGRGRRGSIEPPYVKAPPIFASWDALAEKLDGPSGVLVSEGQRPEPGRGVATDRGGPETGSVVGVEAGAAPPAVQPDRGGSTRTEHAEPASGGAGLAAGASAVADQGGHGGGRAGTLRPGGRGPVPTGRGDAGDAGGQRAGEGAGGQPGGMAEGGPAATGAVDHEHQVKARLAALGFALGDEVELAPAATGGLSGVDGKRGRIVVDEHGVPYVDVGGTLHDLASNAWVKSADVPKARESGAPGADPELDAAFDTLNDLFAVGEPEPMDEERYAKAKSAFDVVVSKIGEALNDVKDVIRTIVEWLRDARQMAKEKILAMRAYIERYAREWIAATKTLNPDQVAGADNQVAYRPLSRAPAGGTLVPVNIAADITIALEAFARRIGRPVDDYVQDKMGWTREQLYQRMQAEQVDALALAIENIDRGANFVLGDQTGVGKGRVVAAVLRYVKLKGLEPVFVTVGPGLYSDIMRDLRDVGWNNVRAVMTNRDRKQASVPLPSMQGEEPGSKWLRPLTPKNYLSYFNEVIDTGRLGNAYDVLFTTYSQFQFQGRAGGHVRAQRHGVYEALAGNAVFVFDESHNAGGTEAGRANTAAAQATRSEYIRRILASSRGAMFSSATWAKNPHVMTLYARTDMGLAFGNDMNTMRDTVKRGGVPLQQIMSTMLARVGQYLRRERSYEGIEPQVRGIQANLDAATTGARTLRSLFELDSEFGVVRTKLRDVQIQEARQIAGDPHLGGAGQDSTTFSSVMHNAVAQMLLSAKMVDGVNLAIEAWKRGEKPIIALFNTMESLAQYYMEEHSLAPGAPAEGFTFGALFERSMWKMRTFATVDPKTGATSGRQLITDDMLIQMGRRDLIEAWNDRLSRVQTQDYSGLPVSPIDYALEKMAAAGMRVGEITGRGLTITRDANGVPRFQRRVPSDGDKKETMNRYNAGDIDGLIINRSGSTGYSLHASIDYVDQKPRHMVLMQFDPNVDIVMQMLGRINRNGQVALPLYTIALSDMPMEKRPAANVMRKLASLNANTSAARKGTFALDSVVDYMNAYGDEVVQEILLEDWQLQRITSIDPGTPDDVPEGLASKFTGRIAILDPEDQARLFERIESNYEALVASLEAMGQNVLEAKVMELDARTVKSREFTKATAVGDSPFAQPSVSETLDIKRISKPLPLDEIRRIVRENVGVASDAEVAAAGANRVRTLVQAAMSEHRDRAQEVHEALDELAKVDKNALHGEARREHDRAEQRARRALVSLDNSHTALSQATTRWRIGGSYVLTAIRKPEPGSPPGQKGVEEVFFGILANMRRKGTAKSALSLSDYELSFLTSEFSAPVRVTLSKIAGGTFQAGPADYSLFSKAHERSSREGREHRTVITGNIPAAMGTVHGGRIIYFRRHNGRVEPGLLMPKDFDPDEELKNRPVTFKQPGQVMEFLDGHPNTTLSTGDEAILVSAGDRTYWMSGTKIPRAILQSQELKAIFGSEWTRRGGGAWMLTTTKAHIFRAALENLYTQHGLTFVAKEPAILNDARKIVDRDQADQEDRDRYAIAVKANGRAVPTEETFLQFLVRRWVDLFAPVRRLVTDLQTHLEKQGLSLSEQANTYLWETLRRGATEDQLKRLRRRYFAPIVDIMSKAGISLAEIDRYLMARHAPERNATIRTRTKGRNQSGSGMTDAEAAIVMAQFAADPRLPAIERLARWFDRMNAETRKLWVRSGLESQDTVTELETQWKFYAPLRTDLDAEVRQLGLGLGVSIGGKEFRAATGRNSKADTPLAFAFAQAEVAIVRAQKNAVAQSFLKLVRQHMDRSFARVIRTKRKKKLVRGYVRTVTDYRARFDPNVVQVKVRGRTLLIEINPKFQPIATALKNSGASFGGAITKNAARVTRTLAGLATRWNPVFPLFNAIRDTLTAQVHMSGEHGAAFSARVLADTNKAFRAYLWAVNNEGRGAKTDWQRYAQEYIRFGGPISGYQVRDVHEAVFDVQRALATGARVEAGRALRKLLERLGNLNDAVENAARLAFYVNARRSLGWSERKAAAEAKELTVNFERRGEMGYMLNAWWMFSNAGIQGLFRGARAWRVKAIRRMLLGSVLGAATLDLINRAIGGDDEDGIPYYDKLPDWLKRTHLVVMVPGTRGDYVSLPLPFVYNWFHALGTNLGAMYAGRITPSAAGGSVLSATLDNINPFGGESDPIDALTPTLFDPILQLSRNRDWAGRPIAPSQLPWGRQKPDSAMFWPDVNPTAKAVTSWLNEATGGDAVKPGVVDVSPEAVEHFLAFMTGGLGKTLGRLFDVAEKSATGQPVAVRDVPYVRRLFHEQNPWWARQRFKENLELVSQAEERVKVRLGAGDRKGALDIAAEEETWLRLRTAARAADRRVRQLERLRDRVQDPTWIEAAQRETMVRFNRAVETATRKASL